jgi:tetratricopeptide (TPR) repeat protein
MPDRLDARSVGELIAVIGESLDVRATLDASALEPDPQLLPALKLEIDRLIHADLTQASRVADAAAWAAERLGDDVSRAFADATQARLLHARSQFKEAEPLYAGAADALKSARRGLDAAALAKHRVEALMMLGRYDEAFALARRARRTLRTRGERRLLAEHDTNIGNLYYYLDRHQDALRYYERAAEVFEELSDDARLAYIDFNRAAVLFQLDRVRESRALYERSADAFVRVGSSSLAILAELAIAYIEYLTGHYHEALRRFQAAKESGNVPESTSTDAFTNLDLAEVYLHLNAFPEAADAARRASEFFTEANAPRDLGTAKRFAGAAAAGLGDVEMAARLFDEVARLYDGFGQTVQAAAARLDLAEVELGRKNWRIAADIARDASVVFERTGLAIRSRRARVVEARAALGAGDLVRAARLARATLKRAERGGVDAVRYHCHAILGAIHALKGQRTEALVELRHAIEAVERLRSRIIVDQFKSSFLEDKVELYESAVGLCLEGDGQDFVEEAFRTLELAKSRSLSDLLSEYLRECVPGDDTGRLARERFKRLVDELAWRKSVRDGKDKNGPGTEGVRKHIRKLDREIEDFEALVSDAFRRLQVQDRRFAELHSPRVVEPGELRELVGANEAIVEYVVTRGSLSAIVVTNEGMRAVRDIAQTSEVVAMLDGVRFQLDKFSFGREYAEREIAHLRRGADLYLSKLYDALVRPLEREIAGKDLVIIPHGRLHYVPFHALFDGEQYLIEKHALSYAPSATVFALCTKMPRATTANALVCGVPDASAPEIERELEALRLLYPNAHVLAGPDATRAAVARHALDCGVVHIASHARFRADNPMLSSLQLADGDFTFYDVLALRLSADLVVLSGCNTGMIAVGAGDELHGLMRGFMYAGAPTLVLSMWSADDATTAELMRVFYKELRSGASKRDALRTAQRAGIRKWSHPYYWAPFVLLGRAV